MGIAFAPCVGRRAQVDAVPVSDGQFLVAVDTGEAFIDFNGIRIRISGGSSEGGSGADDDDDDSHGLLTAFSIVNSALLVSDSVPGGGPGSGLTGTPEVILPESEGVQTTSYSITEAR